MQVISGTQFTGRIFRLLVALGPYHIDGFVQERRNSSALAMELQERRNSSALAMELHLPCINPSIYAYDTQTFFHHNGKGRSASVQFIEGGQQYRLRQLRIGNLTSHTYIYSVYDTVCLCETKSRTLCHKVVELLPPRSSLTFGEISSAILK